ncbi:MAG: bifunctional DNA-formamidopyrimidine glycosylase/DNA-(apurinic or apyrimidinic site) lyase [Acidobacteriia bacterium]|nr:bifunctional DNA-formamidopyrimidine glycosylase/DNA-(apurinic or apyrimidinic site) lyase [Terriglobia bacterium]
MPELPEVETVVRGLRLLLPGRTILDVRLGKVDFVDDPASLAESLPGKRIVDVARLGKFICVALEPGKDLSGAAGVSESRLNFIVHLGMTGQLTVKSAGDPVKSHTHCFFGLDDGQEIRYRDIRRFGRMLVVPESGMREFLGHLGREPLEIGAEEFCKEFSSRRARVKALLLDQRVLRGVGNIYADESLFRARLHPARIAASLTKKQMLALHRAVREILEAAIHFRGSSISDYVDAKGMRGKFQQQHRVYQRKGKACFRCRGKIRRVIVAGRSSYFCPRCQPAPRARKK